MSDNAHGHGRRTPAPGDPSTWPASPDLSRVDLHLIDSDEGDGEGHRHLVHREDTGPAPAAEATRPKPTGDGVKIGIGSASVFAFLALIDKALSGTGLTASDVVEHLGPALGILYQSSPILAGMVVLGYLVLRGYRRDQAAHRRRDRRLQNTLVAAVNAFRTEIVKLRGDVNGLATTLDGVRKEVETKIVSEVGAAAREATARADRTDGTITELRRGQVALETRVARIESLVVTGGRAVESAAPHASLTPAPPSRRPGPQGQKQRGGT